ncbi:MAG: hypothetical protein HY855_20855, partial [Burkholderiales bacterium]|nr:hypothetical protein [Burkholderiales bacterium]
RPQGERAPRPDAARQTERPPRQERPPRPEGSPRPAGDSAAAPPRAPLDPQQQERARLLRDYESTRLSEANFCALKGLTPARLAELLAQARQEAGPAAARPPRPAGSGPRPPTRR